MPSITADPQAPVALFTTGSTTDLAMDTNDRGNSVLRGLRVFRAGTFRDSLGIQHTWTLEHLTQMVFHYEMLRDNGRFPNVPVRVDHSRSAANVVGYIDSLYVDGDYLLADVEFTEPTALEKWERGTFRGRSAEVGFYETNDDEGFWPVFMGVAFVDIPAVEGLYSRQDNDFTVLTEESRMTEQEWIEAAVYAQAIEHAEAVEAAEAEHRAAFYAQGLADARAEFAAGRDLPPATFTVAGERTSDHARVQAHIDALETAANEQAELARTAFVEGLVANHQITAPQGEQFTALVADMTEAQFEAFRAAYSDAPANPLFARHGDVTNPEGDAHTADEQIQVLEEIVANHRRSGLSEDAISKTASYKKLAELKAAGQK